MCSLKVEETRRYWVALNLVLAENLRAAKKVLDRFSRIQDIFTAAKIDLVALGLAEDDAGLLSSSSILDQASAEIEQLEKRGYFVVTLEDESYPSYLREIFYPPIVLYGVGQVEALKGPAVSIVGSRKPSAYGRNVAARLAEDLGSKGVVIVSGLARGIDSTAHQGALKKGRTVAVLGSGLDNIYPRENRALFGKIIEQGAVVTEFPLGSKPLGHHFPIRNRIISGLSLALIVVEATMRSGSLISARLALDQNRTVLSVPGNVTSELSQGTNWLIKSGAKPVARWEDVAEELPSPLREELLSQEEGKGPPSLSSREKEVYDLLKPDSLVHIDEILDKSDYSVSEALSLLLNLELKGLIYQSPGKYYHRRW